MKRNILITGSEGRIGSYLKKKLGAEFNVLSADILLGVDLNDNHYLENIFKKNIYCVIFCHGKNTTPLKNYKKSINLDQDIIESFFKINLYLNLKIISCYLKKNKKGRVINFSSIYSVKSPKHFIYKNFSKEIGYSLSKAAANMMIKYLGTKFSKTFLFNSVVLGGVKQKKLSNFFIKNYNKNNPTGRMMELDEIMPVINFLLDESNTYTNAQEIIVDGGWLSW